ncbi:MAG TPA: hypothetical protein VFB27_07335, partial [Opitutaceae bacterium]|nr:hypothetical protein [Opitutaceae bacterium]
MLRLKRAERPPAEFWVQFDRELHAKQLTALMEKKPRWSLPTRRLVRLLSLPLSAATACALAFIALHPAANEVAQTTLPARRVPMVASRPEPVRAPVAPIPAVAVAETSPVERPSETVPA